MDRTEIQTGGQNFRYKKKRKKQATLFSFTLHFGLKYEMIYQLEAN